MPGQPPGKEIKNMNTQKTMTLNAALRHIRAKLRNERTALACKTVIEHKSASAADKALAKKILRG